MELKDRKISDVFFLTNCDTLIDLDYKNLIDYHNYNKNFITMVSCNI